MYAHGHSEDLLFWSLQLPVASDIARPFLFFSVILTVKEKKSGTLHGEGSRLRVLDMFVLRQKTCRAPEENSAPSLKKTFWSSHHFHHYLVDAFRDTSRVNSLCPPSSPRTPSRTCQGARLTVSAGTMTMSHSLRRRHHRGNASDPKRQPCSVRVPTEHFTFRTAKSEWSNSRKWVDQWPLTLYFIDARLDSKKKHARGVWWIDLEKNNKWQGMLLQ